MIKAILFNLIFILSLSAVAFAGEETNDSDFGKEKPKSKFSIENRSGKQSHSLSLRSGMNFKGENLIASESTVHRGYANFNINFSKEQNSYLLPYKKKALLSKLTFNPNELLRNYSGK